MKGPGTIRALRVVRQMQTEANVSAGRLAHLMWPNDPGWKRVGKCGRGSSRGVGMRLAGGALLAKLARAGLIVRFYRDNGGLVLGLTQEGRDMLAAEGA